MLSSNDEAAGHSGKLLGLTGSNFLFICLGSALIAFAMVNVHDPSRITEGGILGLSLLLKQVFNISQAITSPLLDIVCFAIAFSLLGKQFLKTSAVATAAYAGFMKLFESIGPVIPSLYHLPLLAAVSGGLLVGIGCCLIIMQGGASGGDDALAMAISHTFHIRLSLVFFIMDFVVLGLSLIYIPFRRIFWSFLTTVVSSVVIGQFELHMPKFRKDKKEKMLAEPQNS